MEEINQEIPIVQQRESIKLSKMSKGFNWELKLLPIKNEEGETLGVADIERLEELNNEMKKRFGGLE